LSRGIWPVEKVDAIFYVPQEVSSWIDQSDPGWMNWDRNDRLIDLKDLILRFHYTVEWDDSESPPLSVVAVVVDADAWRNHEEEGEACEER
jgi:hypothetical protein